MKAYIQPALRVERTETIAMMALSTQINDDGTYKPADGSECFTDEQAPSTNVWGEEW